MLFESFKITGIAVIQIFILGALGFILVKKNILGGEGLDALSRLAINVTMPVLIFAQLIKDFNFSLYPHWWIFPLLSVAITFLGLAVGSIFTGFFQGRQHKAQFLSLVAFQNSGYLPLVLIAALLPVDKMGVMFIYLFLFLLGFNSVIFSLGVYMLTASGGDKFEWEGLFSPPVIATLIGLVAVFLGINKIFPEFIYRPLKMIGDSTLPLAMLVVGGNLAQIRLAHVDKKAIILMSVAKLIILPAIGLGIIINFKLPELIGLLILLQLAVPPATTPSVIIRHYKKEDLLISQGIFFGHILSLITLPIFLSLYFLLTVNK
jgi:predicted permease